MDRRVLVAVAAVSAFTLLHETKPIAQDRLQGAPPTALPAQDAADDLEMPYGETRLAISDEDRQGTVYLPKVYKHGVKIPLLVMLHGFGGSGNGARFTFPLAEEFGVLVIAPDSRDITWSQSAPGFDDDGRYIAAAIRAVNDFVDIDPDKVAIAGVSDGATYAMGMGLGYGKTFKYVMGFSEGIIMPFMREGKPKIFIAHGVNDVQMPIDRTSRRFVPQLKSQGYDVTYKEYDGGHGAPRDMVRAAFEWFTGKPSKPQ